MAEFKDFCEAYSQIAEASTEEQLHKTINGESSRTRFHQARTLLRHSLIKGKDPATSDDDMIDAQEDFIDSIIDESMEIERHIAELADAHLAAEFLQDVLSRISSVWYINAIKHAEADIENGIPIEELSAALSSIGPKKGNSDPLHENLAKLPANITGGTFTVPDTLVLQKIYSNIPLTGERHLLEVSERGQKKPVTVTYTALMDRPGISLSKRLGEFDRAVSNAVITMLIDGGGNASGGDSLLIFNERQVLQCMEGGSYRNIEQGATLERIRQSLERLASTRVEIDADDQIKKWHSQAEIDDVDKDAKSKKFILRGYLLPIESVTAEGRNGEKSSAYSLRFVPILLRYSNYTGQFNSFQAAALRITKPDGKALSATTLSLTIRHYLARRIQVMKSRKARKADRSSEYFIRYQSIYEKCVEATDKTALQKKEKARIRETVDTILSSLANDGIIKGHTIHYRGEDKGKGTFPEKIEIYI